MFLLAVLSGRYWVFVEEVSLAGMPLYKIKSTASSGENAQ